MLAERLFPTFTSTGKADKTPVDAEEASTKLVVHYPACLEGYPVDTATGALPYKRQELYANIHVQMLKKF